MNNEKKEKLFINFVLALFIAGIICCFTLYPILCDTVSAEPLTDNSVLNFNQLFDYSKLDSSKISDSYFVTFAVKPGGYFSLDQKISFVAGHKYYIYGAVPGVAGLHFDSTPSHPSFRLINVSNFITAEYSDSYQFYVYGFSTGTFKSIIQIFDLTQCFGVGNEPSTVEEFKSYFNNDYYVYSTSTLISLNTLDSYNNGVNDTLSNLTYSFTAFDSYNRITSANVTINNVSYNSSLDKTSLGSDFVSLGVPGSTKNGVLYFPFSTTLNAGDTISLTGYYGYSIIGSGSYSVDIVVVNGDSFSIIDSSSKTGSTINDLKHIENLNYTLPFSCSGIYFICQGAGVYVSNFTVSVQVLNFQSLIDDAYNAGKSSRDSDVTIAFENGKKVGMTQSNPYSFNALFGAVFDAPIQALTGLLDFNILGVNMKGFYLSLFTLALIILVIKLCLGKV